MKYRHLFGPVNSRRLGLSLGIDPVPFKTCTLDCVYCECGRTVNLTSKIGIYIPVNEIIDELNDFLRHRPPLDVITFSGSGEPTLHGGIGEIIGFLKDKWADYRVAVLTNGALLWNGDVRRSLLRADIVIPSMDAVSGEIFERINRPVKGITPEMIIDGLIDFRRGFGGKVLLEIFIVPGLNDTESELEKIKEAAGRIRPDRLQLNRLDRPGTEGWVTPVTDERMKYIKDFLSPLEADIIGSAVRNTRPGKHPDDSRTAVLSSISRRPATMEDLVSTLGISPSDVGGIIKGLLAEGIIVERELPRGKFYLMRNGGRKPGES
jgi:wyosine [tRNA(Phe)-imidazoG37] synthetase (radical SAM superfamily)